MLQKLIWLRSEPSESFRDNDLRFISQIALFNAIGSSVSLYGAVSGLMLLSHTGVDASQRISILFAAAQKDASLAVSSNTDDFI